jgi:formate-dependent nitrite reductase membrane component NrfD
MTRRRGGVEPTMVPPADFRSYYRRPVLKPPVWTWEVPAYLFTGGLSAGSALLAAGADLTDRPVLRQVGLLSALASMLASAVLLVADLGRPARFHHMLRVAKPTSPMSVGTWILVAFGPGVGIAAVAELLPPGLRHTVAGRMLRRLARPAALSSAVVAPALASYSAVLLSQTAVPAWHEAHPHLPFVFASSAAASAGGLAMVLVPVGEAGPARWFAASGAVAELAASRLMEQRLGLVREAYRTGRAHRLRTWAEWLTAVGMVGTTLAAGRNRTAAVASGMALLGGSALQRFGVFEAGVASTKDPKYVVVPQRRRLDDGRAVRTGYTH